MLSIILNSFVLLIKYLVTPHADVNGNIKRHKTFTFFVFDFDMLM